MAKIAVSLFLAAALCCILQAEGAVWADFYSGVSSAGKDARRELMDRYQKGTAGKLDGELTPEQQDCLDKARHNGLGAFNAALGEAQNNLRSSSLGWAGRLTGLSADQLNQEIKQELLDAANPSVDKLIADSLACV